MTDKENAIFRVLKHRTASCDEAIIGCKDTIAKLQQRIDYLEAKKEGYQQAMSLLTEPLENIQVELRDEP